MRTFEERYVIELGGVSYDERGYLKMTRNNRGAPNKYKWTSLKDATQFVHEHDAIYFYKQSGLDGGVLIETDTDLKEWKTQYTI